MDNRLQELIARISPLDEVAQTRARARQDTLTKPQGSLGKLEALSIRLAGITGDLLPRLDDKVIVTMAADHGVVAEGVSAYPPEVTAQMVRNFLVGGAAINVLARAAGARVLIVDMGVSTDLDLHPHLVNKKVGYGTGNIARGPAMSREQAHQAIMAGVEVAETSLTGGADIVGTGDMGIGNTTASAAIAVVLTGRPADDIVGFGTGVDEVGRRRKIAVVEQALQVNRPNPADALDVLAKVGGFEIGGLVGVILGAAGHRRPVVLDGFISTTAAMLAVSLAPKVRPYLIASHRSQERGHRAMLDWLQLDPLLDLELRLGEGTGAALGIFLAEAACKILAEMATFSEARVAGRDHGGSAG